MIMIIVAVAVGSGRVVGISLVIARNSFTIAIGATIGATIGASIGATATVGHRIRISRHRAVVFLFFVFVSIPCILMMMVMMVMMVKR